MHSPHRAACTAAAPGLPHAGPADAPPYANSLVGRGGEKSRALRMPRSAIRRDPTAAACWSSIDTAQFQGLASPRAIFAVTRSVVPRDS